VEALEQALGLRLFDRLPRGWSLTPEGETLAAQAQRIEDEAIAFSRAALGVSSLRGTVRVSAPPVIASHFLVPRLGALREAWPGIDLEIVGESREANLARGEADLALRLSRPTAPGLVARSLGTIGYGLYAVAAYLERPPAQWEFLGYDESLRRVPQQQWLEKIAAGRRFILRSNDLAALYQGARAGLGIAALPHFLGANDEGLALVPGAVCPVARQLWLVMHPDLRRSPRTKAVADALAVLVSEAQPILLASSAPVFDSARGVNVG
jgi:DNA-binding transcriptional LysR family regulator